MESTGTACQCLGFKDFKNFDGVRFSYKGIKLLYQNHLLYDKGAPDWSACLLYKNEFICNDYFSMIENLRINSFKFKFKFN